MLNIQGETYTKNEFLSIRYKYSFTLLPKGLVNKKFEQLDSEIMKKIAVDLKQWDFEHPLIVSILSNQNGIGKTHAAVCTFKNFLKYSILQDFQRNIEYLNNNPHERIENLRLPDAEWISERELLGKIQESFNTKYPEYSEQEILKKLCEKEFLVIDDIFGNRNNEFSKRILLHILDERSEYQGNATLITSNLRIEEIASIDTRIASRLDNTMRFQIESHVKDYRKNF